MTTLSSLSALQQSPYFDDYDETKKYLRMLFRPSVSLQVRELTQLQTILQDQVARFADHFFKDGSIVTGGQISLDTNVSYIKLVAGATLSNFVNKKIQISGSDSITADVIATVAAEGDNPSTLIVRYNGSDQISATDATIHPVGDTTTTTTTAATGTITGDASIASITAGIFYVNGFFAITDEQTLVLEKYSKIPSYKVGLSIAETVVADTDDSTLLDNAAGSYNVNAPGAYRFKIDLTLAKKLLTTISEVDFIEMMRVDSGIPIKIVKYPIYSELEKTLARRTFDESGDYTTRPFQINLNEHKGSTGTVVLLSGQTTVTGTGTLFEREFKVGDTIYLSSATSTTTTIVTVISDTEMTVAASVGDGSTGQKIFNSDRMSAGLEPGKAYVRGFEYESIATQYADLRKGRDTKTTQEFVVNTNFGNYFKIDNLGGLFDFSTQSPIDIHCVERANIDASTEVLYNTTRIGTARPRQIDYLTGTVGTAGGAYDLYLYDMNFTSVTTSIATGISAGIVSGLVLATATADNTLDAYTGAKIRMTSGSTIGQVRNITAYTTGRSVTIDKAFLNDVASADTCEIDFSSKDIEAFGLRVSNALTDSADISDFGRVGQVPAGDAVQYETNLNSLVYELPQSVVKTTNPIGGTSGFAYTVKQFFPDVSFTTGLATISIGKGIASPGSSPSSVADVVTHIAITVKSDGSPAGTARTVGDVINLDPAVSSQNITISQGSLILKVSDSNSGSNNPDTFVANVIVTIQIPKTTNLASGFRTKTMVSGDTTTFTSGNSEFDNRVIGHFVESTNFSTISLRTSDIKSLKAVIEGTTNIASIAINFAAAVADTTHVQNITDRYNFNTGQKDNYYDHGSITLKPGKSAPSKPIVAVFDYFTHGTEDTPFTVDTYTTSAMVTAGITFSTIPNFTSPIKGTIVNLRNCLDFRPRRKDGDVTADFALDSTTIEGKTSVLPRLPDSDVALTTDVQFYLPRKDKIVLSKDKSFKVIEGISAVDAIVPADDEDSMTIYIADVPEYTFNVTDIDTQYIDNKRFTMRDIGRLEKRIEQLEYYTALSFLEKEAKDEPIFDDAGIERFKNGILVDQFSGHLIGDVINDDYDCAIDYDERFLRSGFSSENFSFSHDARISTNNIIKTGDLITVNHTLSDFIIQPVTTTTETINPFGSTSFNGELTITPASDTWFSETKRPDVLINLEGQNDNWTQGSSYGFGSQWDSWSKNWSGLELNNDSLTKTRKKKSITSEASRTASLIGQSNTREGILSQNQPETIKRNVNNRVVNDTIIPFNREQKILFRAQGLKPGTKHYVYFDGEDVTGSSTPATKLTLASPGSSIFTANEGEYISLISETLNGTLVYADPTGNTSLLIANTSGDWSTTSSGTVVNASYITNAGSSTSNASLSVTASVPTTFVADVNGVLAGHVALSKDTFRSGERLLRITDSEKNDLLTTTSVAEKTYHIKGMIANRDGLVTSTRPVLIKREDIKSEKIVSNAINRDSSSTNYINPMSQTFFVDEARFPNGMFLSQATLYFYAKDVYIPIDLQIRPIINGLPSSSTVIPFAEKTLSPGDVTVDLTSPDTTSATSGTIFKFPSPVYLAPGEYALVLNTTSPFYKVYTSLEGNIVTNNTTAGTKASKTPETGSFFVSQNSSIWQPIQNRSLMFKLERCSFQTTTASSNLVRFFVDPKPLSGATTDTEFDYVKFSTSDLVFSGSVLNYYYKSSSNAASPVKDVTWYQFSQNKNLNFGSRRKIRKDTFSTWPAPIHGQDLSDFIIEAQMSTIDSAVSPVIDMSRLNLITIINDIENGIITDDSVAIIAGGSGYSAGDVNITGTTGTGGTLTLAVTSGVITGAIVNTAGSGYYDNITVTPLIGSNAVINISSELDKEGGNNKVRYITRRVTLEDGFDAKDLRVYTRAYKPSTTNINVYYKILSSIDSESFDDKLYVKMLQETDTNLYSSNENDYKNYVFKTVDNIVSYTVGASTFNNFKTFAIKIVLSSSDDVVSPTIKDLRVIALD